MRSSLASVSGIIRILTYAGLIGLPVAALFVGSAALLRFDHTPGPQQIAPAVWPMASRIERAAGRPGLLLFAHPLCGCTRATLEELAQLAARAMPGQSAPAITVLFFRPAPSSGWEAPATWQQAASIAHSRVLWDDGGREARRFGARTSGLVLLYGADGKLLFRGGVTASRGHSGDNYGIRDLATALASGRAVREVRPVFGCGLLPAEASI